MFEVQDLRYTTLATVSRCGMVWFSSDVISPHDQTQRYLTLLRNVALVDADDMASTAPAGVCFRSTCTAHEPILMHGHWY